MRAGAAAPRPRRGGEGLTVRLRLLVACLAALAWNGELTAEPVQNIRSRMTEPTAIRGGVLMIPLEADKGTDHWPASIDLLTADGGAISGMVIWIHPVPLTHERHWTDDPRGLGIRIVTPEDDLLTVNPFQGEGPHLVARLPMDGDGLLNLGKQTLKPRWIDQPGFAKVRARLSAEGAGGERNFGHEVLGEEQSAPSATSADSQPDPHSPFEYWRWVLMAVRLNGEAPPPGSDDLAGALAAEHFAGLWTMALARLQRVDARAAERLIDMLTRICAAPAPGSGRRGEGGAGGGTTVAAWVADPRPITALLDRMVDLERTDAAIARDAVQWMDAQPAVVIWPVAEFGPTVRLAAMTHSDEPVLASFRWDGTSDGSTVVRLEPSVVTHIEVERAALPRQSVPGMTPPPEPRRQVLVVAIGRHEMRLEFGLRTIEARPPGVLFGTFNAPITLAEAQARMRRALPVEWRTSAQLRKLSGRWEVFVECMRPRPRNVSGDALAETVPQKAQPNIDTFDALRGIEAVTLLLGSETGEGDDRIWLTIPEDGWQQVVHGRSDGTLQVHRRSLDDRWLCRIVLPESWVPLPDRGPMQIALVRSHGDSEQLETSPGLSTPWNAAAARAFIDLAHWDDLTPAR